MARKNTILSPTDIEDLRQRARQAIAPLQPVEKGQKYNYGDKRTNGGRKLPDYYLVYFLLVDLLKFPYGGRWEKVAWTIPVDFNGSAALIEHRKFGLGIFSLATHEDEVIAEGIVESVTRGIAAARPFFDHLAAEAVSGSRLNVTNNCAWLFSRYTFLRDQFREKMASIKETGLYTVDKVVSTLPDGTSKVSFSGLRYGDTQEARWIGLAAIEAFFSWTEHVLIHIGILCGNIRTGQDVARLAGGEWSDKVKAAINLSSEIEMRAAYEDLLEVRRQIRNFLAHGAFGKHGEAFQFHSAAGAVPVNLTDPHGRTGFSMWPGVPSFNETKALQTAELFITKLWAGARAPAKRYLSDFELPVILSYASDGTYAAAMSSEENMEHFIDGLSHEMNNAANMDW